MFRKRPSTSQSYFVKQVNATPSGSHPFTHFKAAIIPSLLQYVSVKAVYHAIIEQAAYAESYAHVFKNNSDSLFANWEWTQKNKLN